MKQTLEKVLANCALVLAVTPALSAVDPIKLSCDLTSYRDLVNQREGQTYEKIHLEITPNIYDKSLPRPQELVTIELHREEHNVFTITILNGRMTDTQVEAQSEPTDTGGIVAKDVLSVQRQSGDIKLKWSQETDGEYGVVLVHYGVCKRADVPVF